MTNPGGGSDNEGIVKRTLLFLPLLLAACDTTPRVGGLRTPPPAVIAPAEAWEGLERIAVVPPDNWTTDLRLQYMNWFRAVIASYLGRKGWAFVSQPVVNRSMTEWKFTMAGELTLFTPKELCDKWGCDAILFWDIRRVGGDSAELSFACVKANGTMLWATGERAFIPLYNVIEPSDMSWKIRLLAMAIGDSLRDFPVRP